MTNLQEKVRTVEHQSWICAVCVCERPCSPILFRALRTLWPPGVEIEFFVVLFVKDLTSDNS